MANNGKDFSIENPSTYSASSSSSSNSHVAQGPTYTYRLMPAGEFNVPEPGIMYVKQQGSGQLLFCYQGEDGKVIKLKVSGEVSDKVRKPAIERFSPEIQSQLSALLNVLDPKLQPLEHNDFYEAVTTSAMVKASASAIGKGLAPADAQIAAKVSVASIKEADARSVSTQKLRQMRKKSIEKPFQNEAKFLAELRALANDSVAQGISYKQEGGVEIGTYIKPLQKSKHPGKTQAKKIAPMGTYPIQGGESSSAAISRRYPLRSKGKPMKFHEPYGHKLENDIDPNRPKTYLHSIIKNLSLMRKQYKGYQSYVGNDLQMKEPIDKMVKLLDDINGILSSGSKKNALSDKFKILEQAIREDNLFLLTDKNLLEINGELALLLAKHQELLAMCENFNKKTGSGLDLTFIKSNISNLEKLMGMINNIYSLNQHRAFVRNGGLNSLNLDELQEFKQALLFQKDQGEIFFNHEAVCFSWDALIGVVNRNIANYNDRNRNEYNANVERLNQMEDSEFIIKCRGLLQEFDLMVRDSDSSNTDKENVYRDVNVQFDKIFLQNETDKEQEIIDGLEKIVAAERARRDNRLTVASPPETVIEKGKESSDSDSDSEFAVDTHERPVLNKPLPSPVRASSPDFFSESGRNAKAQQPNPVSSDTPDNLGVTGANNEKAVKFGM